MPGPTFTDHGATAPLGPSVDYRTPEVHSHQFGSEDSRVPIFHDKGVRSRSTRKRSTPVLNQPETPPSRHPACRLSLHPPSFHGAPRMSPPAELPAAPRHSAPHSALGTCPAHSSPSLPAWWEPRLLRYRPRAPTPRPLLSLALTFPFLPPPPRQHGLCAREGRAEQNSGADLSGLRTVP